MAENIRPKDKKSDGSKNQQAGKDRRSSTEEHSNPKGKSINERKERWQKWDRVLREAREDFCKKNPPGTQIPFDLFHNPEDGPSWY